MITKPAAAVSICTRVSHRKPSSAPGREYERIHSRFSCPRFESLITQSPAFRFTTLRNIFLALFTGLPCIFCSSVARVGVLVCYCLIEKGAFTPKAPRWKVDGRQSSSVSVLLPTGCPKRVAVKQESIPGRVSWFTSTIRNTSLGPLKKGAGRWRFSFF